MRVPRGNGILPWEGGARGPLPGETSAPSPFSLVPVEHAGERRRGQPQQAEGDALAAVAFRIETAIAGGAGKEHEGADDHAASGYGISKGTIAHSGFSTGSSFTAPRIRSQSSVEDARAR